MIIEVRVQPRAKRNALVPWPGGGWKLCLTAPAVEGQANAALIEFFARGLGIARSRVRIARGERSRQKLVALDDVTEARFRQLVTGEKA